MPNGSDNLIHHVPEKKPEETVLQSEQDTKSNCREAGYYLGDTIFSTFVVAPLVINVWRGTWGIMELHPKMFPYGQSYILGIVIHISFALIRSHLFTRSQDAWGEGRAGRWLRERFLSRVYTYIFILACIMHWRGGWGLFDASVAAIVPDANNPHRPVLICAFTLVLYMGISCLRSARNLLASPYFLCTDGKETTYNFTTRFKKPAST